jgi:hypothetical protein
VRRPGSSPYFSQCRQRIVDQHDGRVLVCDRGNAANRKPVASRTKFASARDRFYKPAARSRCGSRRRQSPAPDDRRSRPEESISQLRHRAADGRRRLPRCTLRSPENQVPITERSLHAQAEGDTVGFHDVFRRGIQETLPRAAPHVRN